MLRELTDRNPSDTSLMKMTREISECLKDEVKNVEEDSGAVKGKIQLQNFVVKIVSRGVSGVFRKLKLLVGFGYGKKIYGKQSTWPERSKKIFYGDGLLMANRKLRHDLRVGKIEGKTRLEGA
ncbi:hypothetical protein RYX36_013119 [Vicia faba]